MGARGSAEHSRVFGRSSAREVTADGRTRSYVRDVAGLGRGEAGDDGGRRLLRHPEKCRRLGRPEPHGVASKGPTEGQDTAGAGSAGEATFRSSRWRRRVVEAAIVGVGASRVRELSSREGGTAGDSCSFDELAEIGRSRNVGVAGSAAATRAEQTAEPDPYRDGRLRLVDRRDRHGARTGPTLIDQALFAQGRFDRRLRQDTRSRGPRGDPDGAHARRAACRPTSISAGSRRRRPGWSARLSRTSPTRPRARSAARAPRSSPSPTFEMRRRSVLGRASGD